jgi:hypothetical protein
MMGWGAAKSKYNLCAVLLCNKKFSFKKDELRVDIKI